MKRSVKVQFALLAVAGLGVLAWPGPAGAATNLGGYDGAAVAEPIRVEIFEPTIPIPSTPQIDGGIAYTQATADTGPVARALASYLWPGPVVGDGFGVVTGDDSAKYPVQVNSETPATASAPSQNSAQLTQGNGMTTSSTEDETKATATGAGIAGPDTDLTSGVGSGLSQLGGSAPSSSAPAPASPVPVAQTLAGIVTAGGVSSTSDILLGPNLITSTAHAYASKISLLGGIITIGSVDITSVTTSNGVKATNSATVSVGDVKVAGTDLGLNANGVNIAGNNSKVPTLPGSGNDQLSQLGITFQTTQVQPMLAGSSGSYAAQGMIISIDTVPLKNMLNSSSVTDPLANAISKIPNIGNQIAPALGLGPKIQVELGNVMTSSMAAPAYTYSSPIGATSGGATAPMKGTTAGATGSTGGGTVSGGGGSLAGGGTTPVTTGGTAGGTTPVTTGGIDASPVANTASAFPPLGSVPKALILGGLVLAGAVAWALRNAGGFLFGGAGDGCEYGLDSGAPDLRREQ